MVPPEVILDRWIRERRLQQESPFTDYIGKLDIERVKSPSFRSFLRLFKETANEALQLADPNASGGAQPPPFHFDYADVNEGIQNAHAFQHGGFLFIVATVPMIELIFDLSQRLSRAPRVLQLLHLDPDLQDPDTLQGLIFQIQLAFLVSHEYTHHRHRHLVGSQDGAVGVWSEFPHDATSGGINSQAQELDADGYATCLVLRFLLRGERRQGALQELGRADMPGADNDELLLACFFLAVLAFFLTFWHRGTDMAHLRQSTHPPPPVRITSAIRVAEMWCSQNRSVPESWFAPARFQTLFNAAAEAIGGLARETWDAHMSFLRSADGVQYDLQLHKQFGALRQKLDE
ncbi:MAG: hypothetical protein ACLQGV_02150 [Bryobacteraceae bacterium]